MDDRRDPGRGPRAAIAEVLALRSPQSCDLILGSPGSVRSRSPASPRLTMTCPFGHV